MMGMHGAIVDATHWRIVSNEPAGADEKIWLEDPRDERRWLFKPVLAKDGRRQGEDWAEKISSEVARLIGVPAAPVRLAIRWEHGTRVEGALSGSVVPTGWEMHHGSVLLSELVADFDPMDRGRRGHNLETITQALAGCSPPPDLSESLGLTAFDVFCGYLILDAWIANQDRHSDNWSVLIDPQGQRYLMASYDHASCLGFNLDDRTRKRVLHELEGHPGVRHWVKQGRARRFEDGRTCSLVDFAAHACRRAASDGCRYWLARLAAVTDAEEKRIVDSVDGLSHLTRTFCMAVLQANRRRLLDACDPSREQPTER